MSWKNVKDHYRIDHHVQVTQDGICIGSPYIHNIIVISLDGRIVKECDRTLNDNLTRYQAEMHADPAKLKQLVIAPDTFSASIPVYTYDGAEIIKKFCEVLGWPNVTHDGDMMYENKFFAVREDAIEAAKRNCEASITVRSMEIAAQKERMDRSKERLEKHLSDARTLALSASPAPKDRPSGVVEVCPICDIAGCKHLRAAHEPDWKDDPSSDKRWMAGLDYCMAQLCDYLSVNPSSVMWDAATETLDGDVQSVIGNILRKHFGEDWGPTPAPKSEGEYMTDNLLPCPFCGGRAERVDIDEGENTGGSCICCTVCQASGNVEFGRKENFVSNWNRRPICDIAGCKHLRAAPEEGRHTVTLSDHQTPAPKDSVVTTGHTPTPWAIRQENDDWEVYPLRDGPPKFGEWAAVATCHDQYDDTDEAKANAKLIVAAVNAYVTALATTGGQP